MQLLLTMLNTAFTWILNNIGSIATIAIAILTFFYVRATKAMVVEMKEARKEQQRPCILADLTLCNGFWFDMLIKNIGNGAAKNVKIRVTPDIIYHEKTMLSELPIFKNGIAFLPPNKEIKFFFGVGHELLKEGNPRRFDVNLEYEDTFSNSYSENIALDLSVYEKLSNIREKGIPALHQELEKIRGILDRAAQKMERIADAFENGLRLLNYEFVVIPKETSTKDTLKGKLEECINVWDSIYYQDGRVNFNKLYTLRLLGSLLVSLASNCSELESNQKDRILKIAQKIEETNDMLRVLCRTDEFERSGKELVVLCKETLSLFKSGNPIT